MPSFIDVIRNLGKQLYPTGRAFNIPKGTEFDKFNNALAEKEKETILDAVSIYFSILPDNNNFTTDDADRWEERLGMITNSSVPLADRKAAIIRKMNHPGDIPARQSADYIQQSLQEAGFTGVYIHQNNPVQTIIDVLSSIYGVGQQGDGQQGDFQQGTFITAASSLLTVIQQSPYVQQGMYQQGTYIYPNKVANQINELIDSYFDHGSSWKNVFWVGGVNVGDFANVSSARKDEFRQLILKLKPVESVGYLFINYV